MTADPPPLDELEAAVQRAPADVEAWLRLSDGYGAAEMPELRAEILQHAVRIAPASADARGCLGDALIDAGRPRDAIPHLQEAARLDPDHAAWRTFDIGIAFAQDGDHATAVEHFRKALELHPRFEAALFRLGRSLLAECRYSEAVPAFEKALAYRPNHARLLFGLGNAYAGMGDAPRPARRSNSPSALTPSGRCSTSTK